MKDELRYKFKIKRKYFQHSQREVADGAICDNVIALFGDRTTFFIYYSFGSEADTKNIIARLLSLGKRVLLPRVEGEDIVPVQYRAGDALTKNSLGVYEPCGAAYSGGIDVVLVPMLAFNSQGYRLGYGGGYYDRFLKNCTAVRAGIAYDFQLTQFDHDPWDEPLHLAITQKGVYYFGN